MFFRHYLRKQKIQQCINQNLPPQPLKNKYVLADKLASYLDAKDLVSMSRANKDSQLLFNKSLTTFKIQALLKAIVMGEYQKVDDMLTYHPNLLLLRGTITDHAGRTHVNRTAYQLALGAGDFNIKDKNGNIVMHGMVEMIEKHFKTLPLKTAKEIDHLIYEQYIGQFPKNHEVQEKIHLKKDSAALRKVVNMIGNATKKDCELTAMLENKIIKITYKKNSKHVLELKNIIQAIVQADSKNRFELNFTKLKKYLIRQRIINVDKLDLKLLKALYEFRWHLTPRRLKTQGSHFNYLLLVEALQLYVQNYRYFGNYWNDPKNLLCWQKIIGTIQRYLPACDAQNIAQGLWYILEHGEISKRTLEFRRGDGAYFPIDSSEDLHGIREIIGHNCAWSQAGFIVQCAAQDLAQGFIDLIEKIIIEKNNAKLDYANLKDPEEKNCTCGFM